MGVVPVPWSLCPAVGTHADPPAGQCRRARSARAVCAFTFLKIRHLNPEQSRQRAPFHSGLGTVSLWPHGPVPGPPESKLAVSMLQWVFSENKDVLLRNHVTLTSHVTLSSGLPSGPVLSTPNAVPVPTCSLSSGRVKKSNKK